MITGNATMPSVTISPKPMRIPRQMIPKRKILLMLKSIPGLKTLGTLIIFPMNRPIIIASMIDEIGLFLKPIISIPT